MGEDGGRRRRSSTRLDVGELLEAAEAAPPAAAADVVRAALAELIGAEEVSFLIADLSGDALIRLAHIGLEDAGDGSGRETAERVPLGGTPHGRALAGQAVEIVGEDGGARVFAPVTNRGEAVGVLELRLPGMPDEQTVADIARAAHALAYLVIANRRYTDLFEKGRRNAPLSLAGEIQHRLLPGAYTLEASQFTVSAWLEPAGDVGGDTFDFSLDREALYFSLTDAMGHSVNSSMLATLLIGSVRNARRRGSGVGDQARAADAALAEHAVGSQFVTGQIARVDLAGGAAEIVNAGHPLPLRLRDGVIDEVPLRADPPFGAVSGSTFRPQALPLEPGDRLLFVTDGVLDRRASSVELRAILTATRDDHPREAVQRLIQAGVQAAGGSLQDDATALCFDWHGGPPRARTARSGANRLE